MSLDTLSTARMTAVMIGNESLLIQCATIWRDAGHVVSAVVTRASDIRTWAETEGLRVVSSDSDIAGELLGDSFDWLLSIANLDMLPGPVLNLPRKGAVNFHDGPLPRYAGLNAPVWARMAQEARHGITWHKIEERADTGDIIAQRMFDISQSDTALTLNTKAYAAAIESFPEVVTALSEGAPNARTQDMGQRSYFGLGKLPEAAGRIDFRRDAQEVVALVRALDHGDYFNPLCAPKIVASGRILLIGSAEIAESAGHGEPGAILAASDETIIIACGRGAVTLSRVTDTNGKAEIPGNVLREGERLPLLDRGAAETLSATVARVAKSDAFWRTQMAAFLPASLPLVATSGDLPEMRKVKLTLPELPSKQTLTAVTLWALRSGVAEACDIALQPADLPRATGILSDWVPLRISAALLHDAVDLAVDKVSQSAELLKRHGTWMCDLIARDTNIAKPSIPDIAVTFEDSGALDGAALTVALGAAPALHYDASRLSEPHAKRLAARLELLLAAMPTTEHAQDLPFLPETERKDLLTKWNETEAPFDADATIVSQFETQVSKTPDAPALVFEHEVLSYADLNARANRAAHVLRDMGVTRGSLVGLCTKRGPDLVAGALAILKAGGAYVPMDPTYPAERLAHFVTDSGCGVIVTQAALSQNLPDHQTQVLELDTDTRLSTAIATNPDAIAKGEDLAYLIYTSGSTGTPKGVMVEHGNVANFFAGMDARITHQPGDTWLAVTSLSFDISVLELFWTLSRGFKLVVSGDETTTQISNGRLPAASGGMEMSIYYWGNDDGQGSRKYELLLEGAKFADAHGFCAVWTPERHFHAFGGPYPNPSVTGAAVAAVTKQIGVRAGSCVAPLHHTARIAEEWAVIDNLTNGRAGMAIASGWQPDDFVLRPENTPPANKPAMFEQMADLRKLWRGEKVSFPKKDGSMHAVVTQPRPVSEDLPLWVTTAGNPETWKEAGRHGCNVLTHLLGQSVDEVGQKIALYHDALREAGHDPKDFSVTLMLHSFLANDRETAREIAREPMKDYLRSAAGLIKQYAWAFPAFKKPEGVDNAFQLDLGSLTEEELEGILDFAFLRYFEDSGLFGTVDDALDRVEQVKRIGVTEIACLIDYGIDSDTVLEGLKPLAEVLRLANEGGELDPSDVSIAAQIIRHDVSHLQCTPSMARMIAMNDEARFALGRINHLMVGGEALSGALVADLNAATDASVQNMYGPTETTIWSTTDTADAAEGIANIGAPIANTQVYVLDASGQPAPVGVAGELLIGGAGVTRGYWRREKLTAERFVANPFGEGRLYKTGDLVRWRDDGKLDFLGRADHQVKLRGYRIELGEIETRLEEIAGIAQAVVVPREDTPGDIRLVAYLRGDTIPAEADLRAALRTNLPNFMRPQHYVTVSEFPLTPNKKVDRKALPAPEETRTVEVAKSVATPSVPTPAVVTGDVAATVATIWARVLGVAEVNATDNFFDIGGHSLLAVQAHRDIRTETGASKLSITDIFRFPTMGGLVARIEELTGSARPENAPRAAAAEEVSERADSRAELMSKRRAMRARRRART
ncbi:natural product biosynthesis luciferase-like monooxygenase protein [Shimia isoporae]|uniref:Natural product biosynthesis luciferase-like monooxygenase protein n=1 Tax=Shimia isoporae TaxID=647720 RepID=A0A4R1NBC8_9RHOB|nr:MupA/Atu3671 family FMN-dependent luciferase-like monooxygenase [Shimia isoporae]TCL00726.1 natural product biosynthesis luciferase-like monooxygenase protein [Shimia isoporae]